MYFKKICYNCMKEKETEIGVCPYCGYDNTQYTCKEDHLSPLTPLNGKYIIGRVLGAGGFGITYVAMDLHLQIVVAIKELYLKNITTRDNSKRVSVAQKDRACFETNKKRFLQEARVLAMFNENDNEGIVIVKDHFEENDTAYIVMEYLNGTTLKEKVAGHGLDYETVKNLMKPVIHALDKVHQFNVVHLDVSPDNIMILKDNSAKLLDFGGAKNIEGKAESGFVAYKRGYAPIEQYAENGRIGKWTDVYAAAATIYFCLVGKKPVSSMDRQAGEELVKPSKLGVKIPSQVENAIMKGLELDPDKRYQTMEEFWAALNVTKSKKPLWGIIAGVAIAAGVAGLCFGGVLGPHQKTYKVVSEATAEPEQVTEAQEKATAEPEQATEAQEEENQELEQDTNEPVVEDKIGKTVGIELGTYIFENVKNPDYIMGVDSSFGDNGARLVLKKYYNKNSNRFSITDEIKGDGFYNIHAAHTNSYIETKDTQEYGSELRQYNQMYDMGTEKWVFVYCGHDDEKNMDVVILKNAAGSVMKPLDGKVEAGQQIVLAEEDLNDDAQKWYMRWNEKDLTEETVVVYNEGDIINYISDVMNISSAYDANFKCSLSKNKKLTVPELIIWENVWDETQKFEFSRREDSWYKIYPLSQAEGEHKCLRYDQETNSILLADDYDDIAELFHLIYGGYNQLMIQNYDDTLWGFEIGEDSNMNGVKIIVRPYESVEDSRLVKWMIEKPVEE